MQNDALKITGLMGKLELGTGETQTVPFLTKGLTTAITILFKMLAEALKRHIESITKKRYSVCRRIKELDVGGGREGGVRPVRQGKIAIVTLKTEKAASVRPGGEGRRQAWCRARVPCSLPPSTVFVWAAFTWCLMAQGSDMLGKP